MCVQNFIGAAVHECTRFRTTLDFNRGSSNRQPENGVMNVGPLTKNNLDLWPMTLKFNKMLESYEIHLRAKFHQAKCSGSWVIETTNFLPYLAMVKSPKIQSCDLDLWPMILKIDRIRAIARHMFLQNVIKLSAAVYESWVIVGTRKNSDENKTVRRYRGQ